MVIRFSLPYEALLNGMQTGICRSNQFQDPVYNLISDRRGKSGFQACYQKHLVSIDVIDKVPGGRTAWSSTVTVTRANPPTQHNLRARFWYDGTYIDNAKEDAAEVAVLLLTGSAARNGTSSNGATASNSSGCGST